VARLQVKVLAEYPHDPEAYTQGLLWHQGWLYESTGRYGQSSVRRYRPGDQEISERTPLDAALFGEGLALVDRTLVQITWKDGVAFWYAADGLERLREHRYAGEGWGLTYDGTTLWMSDGSHVLTRRDPETLEVKERLMVRRHGAPLDRLNELEWVAGWLYANVYQTDEIVRIDPVSGEVVATIDASRLLQPDEAAAAEVLNGIAHRPDTNTYFLTGKLWPKIFEVTFEPAG
jgi:glutaminyl-peptide cyclotransferase